MTFYELKDRVAQLTAANTEDNAQVSLRVTVEHQLDDNPDCDPYTVERPVARVELERGTRHEVVIS